MDDKDRTTVHMFNLKASHEGDYECYIKYSDGLVQTVMKLSVTGKTYVLYLIYEGCCQVFL